MCYPGRFCSTAHARRAGTRPRTRGRGRTVEIGGRSGAWLARSGVVSGELDLILDEIVCAVPRGTRRGVLDAIKC